MVDTGSRCLLPGECKGEDKAASLPQGLTVGLREELPDSPVTWTVPYKGLFTDGQRAAWLWAAVPC